MSISRTFSIAMNALSLNAPEWRSIAASLSRSMNARAPRGPGIAPCAIPQYLSHSIFTEEYFKLFAIQRLSYFNITCFG